MAKDEEFHRLWPTILVRRQLADAQAHNAALAEFVTSLHDGSHDLTVDYRANDLFNIDQPQINWLRQAVNGITIDYLRHVGIDYPVRWRIQGWSNINRLGDYHDFHNHPRAYLSGTYYVQVPEGERSIGTRSDLRSGCITFYDPRYAANMNAIAQDPYVDPEFTVSPKAGLLMLWPAFLQHFVHPNLAEGERISISYNINLIWQDHYLPQQS